MSERPSIMLSILLPYKAGIDGFEAGFFVWNRTGRVPVPVRVWYGAPPDPVTGERMDRSWRWQFEFGGQSLECFADQEGNDSDSVLAGFWPKCRDERIDEARYRYLVDRGAWARQHDAYDPFSDRRGRVDLLSATIPVPGE